MSFLKSRKAMWLGTRGRKKFSWRDRGVPFLCQGKSPWWCQMWFQSSMSQAGNDECSFAGTALLHANWTDLPSQRRGPSCGQKFSAQCALRHSCCVCNSGNIKNHRCNEIGLLPGLSCRSCRRRRAWASVKISVPLCHVHSQDCVLPSSPSL